LNHQAHKPQSPRHKRGLFVWRWHCALVASLVLLGEVLLGEVLLGEVLLGEVLLGEVLLGEVLLGEVLQCQTREPQKLAASG
jgi:hypothetical protein